MKTFRMIAAAALVSALTFTATADAKRHHTTTTQMTAQGAADANHRLQLIAQSLVDDGYTLSGTQEQPIYYFIAPQAPYSWGHLVYTYSRPVAGNAVLIERVEISADVNATADGYQFPSISIREIPAQ